MKIIRSNLKKHMQYLCFGCGSRHSGSPGEAKAADYIESTFREYGFNTYREKYPGVGWDIRGFSLWNVTKQRYVPSVCPCFFSQSADITDELLWLTPDMVRNLEHQDVKGRLCFVEFWNTDSFPGGSVAGRNAIAEKLDEMEAAAAIFISNIHSDLAPSTKIVRSPRLNTLGVAAASLKGVMDIASNKTDTYRLIIDANRFETECCNVIARVNGGRKKVVFGGHYDTAPLIQGAADNATGTAMVMEMARLLKDELYGYSADFCAFSGEEYMLDGYQVGSGAYIKQHKGENICWYNNFDDGCQPIGDYVYFVTHQELFPAGVVFNRKVESSNLCSDDNVFSKAGIPTLWLHKKTPFSYFHTAEDTYDKIDFDRMVWEIQTDLEVVRQLLAK